jgi:hypothetical protein
VEDDMMISKDSPKAFRVEILALAMKNALDDVGSPDTTECLLQAYCYERDAAELKSETIMANAAEDYVRPRYIAERQLLSARGFDDEHYATCFDYPEAMPRGAQTKVPVSFLNDLARILARRDHANDEVMYRMFKAEHDAQGAV